MKRLLLLACLSGCVSGSSGLRIVHPEDESRVASLQPTLRWEPFDLNSIAYRKRETRGTVSNVTYELRLWHEKDEQIDLVYQVEGLEQPEHRIEVLLFPEAQYRWSVRASFLLENRRRVTEWSLQDSDAQHFAVPNQGCAAFVTP